MRASARGAAPALTPWYLRGAQAVSAEGEAARVDPATLWRKRKKWESEPG
jgi:hypothetical protein